MNRNGEALAPQDQQPTIFARYVTLLLQVLRTNQAEVAREIHISPSTISKAMKSTKRVEEDTILQIWQAFVTIAERKEMERVLDASFQENFFNAAHCTTEQQVSLAEQRFESLTQLFDAGRERRSSSGQT